MDEAGMEGRFGRHRRVSATEEVVADEVEDAPKPSPEERDPSPSPPPPPLSCLSRSCSLIERERDMQYSDAIPPPPMGGPLTRSSSRLSVDERRQRWRSIRQSRRFANADTQREDERGSGCRCVECGGQECMCSTGPSSGPSRASLSTLLDERRRRQQERSVARSCVTLGTDGVTAVHEPPTPEIVTSTYESSADDDDLLQMKRVVPDEAAVQSSSSRLQSGATVTASSTDERSSITALVKRRRQTASASITSSSTGTGSVRSSNPSVSSSVSEPPVLPGSFSHVRGRAPGDYPHWGRIRPAGTNSLTPPGGYMRSRLSIPNLDRRSITASHPPIPPLSRHHTEGTTGDLRAHARRRSWPPLVNSRSRRSVDDSPAPDAFTRSYHPANAADSSSSLLPTATAIVDAEPVLYATMMEETDSNKDLLRQSLSAADRRHPTTPDTNNAPARSRCHTTSSTHLIGEEEKREESCCAGSGAPNSGCCNNGSTLSPMLTPTRPTSGDFLPAVNSDEHGTTCHMRLSLGNDGDKIKQATGRICDRRLAIVVGISVLLIVALLATVVALVVATPDEADPVKVSSQTPGIDYSQPGGEEPMSVDDASCDGRCPSGCRDLPVPWNESSRDILQKLITLLHKKGISTNVPIMDVVDLLQPPKDEAAKSIFRADDDVEEQERGTMLAKISPDLKAMLWLTCDTYFDTTVEKRDYDRLLQRYILTHFFFELGGDGEGGGWRSAKGWLTGVHECEWEGVECNLPDSSAKISRRVRSLDRDAMHLVGNLPLYLHWLESLEELRLASNDIRGSVPAEIGDLPSLAHLDLESNSLGQEVPPELCNLSNLQILRLNDNLLTGTIPREFGESMDLVLLHLHDNDLRGAVPDTLCQLVKNGTLTDLQVDVEEVDCRCCS